MILTANGLSGGCNIGVLALCISLLAAPVSAQDDSSSGGLEEIVVKAQRRDQNMSDVPVSVSLVSGGEIAASGISSMFEMQQNVPGLIVGQSQTTTSSNFAIRGIGSTANNFGVESSVGLYVDGVYRSRQSSMVNELIDVEAAEVLRGPQGTLFGKNTAAGAILIRTVAPELDTTNAFIDVTAGDYGLTRISAAGNIRLADNIAFRGTIFSSQRDGYVSDLFLGSDVYNNRDRLGLRAQLAFNGPDDDFNMRIIADYAELDENCCIAVARYDGLISQTSLAAFPALEPGSDAVLVGLGGTVSATNPYPPGLLDGVFGALPGTILSIPFEDYVLAQNYLPESRNEDRGISLEMNKAIGDLTLSSVTAYREFDTYDRIDGDFSNVDLLERINIAGQQSISQELRLSGDFGDKGSFFQVGLYYFGQNVDSLTHTNGGPLLEPYVLAGDDQLVALIGAVNQVAANSGGLLPPAASPFPPGFFVTEDMKQEHDGWAAFGQTDLVLSDYVTLTLGARYTDEEKSINGLFTQTAAGPPPDLGAMILNLAYIDPTSPVFNPALFNPLVFLPVMLPNNGWGGYLFDVLAPRPDMQDKLSDDQFTGTAKLSVFPNDNIMFYGSYATGFKAGGTNTDRINPALSPIFGPETSTSLEVGFKGSWQSFRVGVSLYQTDYEDFQANTFTGTGFNVQNAGEIETDGWEIEYTWQPFDNTTISGYFAKSTGKYKSFLIGTCWDEGLFHLGITDPGDIGDPDGEICDRTGDVIPYNPEDRAFIALTQDFPVGFGNVFVRAEYTYASSMFTDGDLDPLTYQDGSELINIRLGMDIDSWNSRITLWGRNVTDERTFHGSFGQPLGAGRMNGYPTEPATYGISFSKNWD